MKKQIITFSLGLALLPSFCDDVSQNVKKLNAAKLLVEDGTKSFSQISKTQKENAESALGIIQNIEISDDVKNFERTYYSVCAKARLLLQEYEEVKKLWVDAEEREKTAQNEEHKIISEELKYFAAVAYFQTDDYKKSAKILETCKRENKNSLYILSRKMLASSYFKAGNYDEASKIYEWLKSENLLTKEELIDYSKVLYRQMQYKEASEVLSDLNFEEALIIKGACALAQKNFEAAAGFYARCNTNNLEALYLKAYAEYKNGKYSQSLNDFEKYISVIQNGEKMSEACYFATQSCLYLKDYKRAEKNAELYLESVINQNEKEKAVFLLGDILYDQKKYDKAINLYRQFTKDKSEFSVKCLYKTAICQGISGNIKEASNTYLSVYERFPVSKDADEALFRSGEILYMENMYTEAVKNLKRYYETFPKGAYTDSAMYYEFDSWIKLGDKTKALLLGNKIIMQNPNSSFLNVVLDRIYEINYERGDYDSAYKAAVQLAERTGHKDQGLEKRISYMNRIIQGGNKDQIKAEMEYENAGGKNTLLGREKGTALAKMYSLDSETKYKAFSLAQELLAVQEKDIVNEREYAAINALIMADYFYEQNKKYEASEKYLKAAEYSRMNGDDEKAAFSLYTAAECFMHLGKKGDANETAALLRKLYPESKYSEAVRSLLK